ESLHDVGARLEILFLLWGVYLHSGDCREAQSTAERFGRLAGSTRDPSLAPIAYRLIGNALHFGGKQRKAQFYFDSMLEFYTSPGYQRHSIWSRYDLRFLDQS